MADVARIGFVAGSNPQGTTRRSGRPHGPASFQQAMHRALQAPVPTNRTTRALAQPAVARVPPAPKPTSVIPAASDAALSKAMALEGTPPSWQDGLRFLMAQESGGKVDARNPVHSARGLFQLTKANYHLNPNGAASFGNAVEEAQGGIRYVQQRYGSADKAVTFWRQHHWY